ncbi:MAG: Fis family transcriptional regulator, partial [Desulfobacterales bacterium CG23_combo_of_CG06-09_8_20_14_all_51_8]
GNVRELIHTMESVFTMARLDPTLFSHHLPTRLRVNVARRSVDKNAKGKNNSADTPEKGFPKFQAVRESAMMAAEKQYLQGLMNQARGDIREAIRISGLSQSRLYSLLKKYQIPRF